MKKLVLLFLFLCGAAQAQEQFIFAWPLGEKALKPRGATTRGVPVTLDTTPSPAWTRLTEPNLSAQERDRRAILAMAGVFRTSFEFLEVIGFRPGFVPDRPYQSWATEYVYVARDEPRPIYRAPVRGSATAIIMPIACRGS